VKLSGVSNNQVTSKFDLSLFATENQELDCVFEYNTDLFATQTITQLASSLQQLLKGISKNANKKLSQLPLLTEQEQTHLVLTLNQNHRQYPQRQCIQHIVEQQAQNNPDKTALIFQGQTLNYQQLNQQANQLAHYLLAQNVAAGDIIGLCMHRSMDMIVALLAILKTGAAYLPLDAELPQARLAHMIKDSGLKLIITQQGLAKTTAKMDCTQILLDQQDLKTQPQENPIIKGLNANSLAYVIYTSGSTGKPKGVLQKHATIVNLVQAQANDSALTGSLLSLQFAPISFDVSIQEIATAWYTASPLVLITEQQKEALDQLPQLLQQLNIGRLFVPPAVLNWLAEELQKQGQQLPELKEIIVAGEALQLSKSLKQYLTDNDVSLWNHYGPTETHVASIAKVDINKAVNIGKAVANLQIYILDQHRQLLPYGAIGELYVGGAGVAKGYLNQAELTQQRFIANPFTNKDDDILYQTGDLVRYLSDGSLDFIGRADQQVQIRGFRIELGEIETQINAIENINSSVLIVDNEQLIAYVCTESDTPEAEIVAAIKTQLQQQLPSYMLPSVFVFIEHIPLTANGKLDKKALPRADATDIQSQYLAPVGEVEQKLASIWAQLLKFPVDKISADGNFFELGGHSLLSVKLVSEIRQQFKAEISIRDIFEYPQLAQLGRHISQAEGSQLPPIKPVKRKDNKIVPSFAQQRLWFIDQMDGGSAHYNMPSALRLQGNFKIDVAQQAFTEIIQRHESLRTVFIDDNDGPLQVIQNQFDFTIKTTDLRQLAASKKKQTVMQAIEKDATQAFDLSQDLMLRVSYLKLSDDEGILLFNMHHIASDGWSTGILVNEFVRLYESILTGKANPLAPLPIQYADYAYWQRNWLQGEVLDKQLNYWDRQLAELPQIHSLPLDYERPQYQTFNGEAYAFKVGADTLKGLQKIVRDKKITLFMLMHAAFSLLLSRYSNNNDIVIGTAVANRRQKELESLIGFFVNTLVLRADCS
ncbi:MAG TPA: amino acid adenylation domain-containing protein, partial [Oceanospirillales bacterium]|nr:amino acid adenylation domain-containing protein [Oceanospirillales bacterium]